MNRKRAGAQAPISKDDVAEIMKGKHINDPNDYKKISLTMNKYTYDLLVQASEADQRSLVQTMRLAIQHYGRSIQA